MTDTPTQPGQNVQQAGLRAMQQDMSSSSMLTQHHLQARYPNWPTSKPGPLAKQALPGQRSINALRREQMVEVDYHQATAEPSTIDAHRYLPDQSLKGRTGFDQLETAQEANSRRKKRY